MEVPLTRYAISKSEAIDIASGDGEAMRRVVRRECGSPPDQYCLQAIKGEATAPRPQDARDRERRIAVLHMDYTFLDAFSQRGGLGVPTLFRDAAQNGDRARSARGCRRRGRGLTVRSRKQVVVPRT